MEQFQAVLDRYEAAALAVTEAEEQEALAYRTAYEQSGSTTEGVRKMYAQNQTIAEKKARNLATAKLNVAVYLVQFALKQAG